MQVLKYLNILSLLLFIFPIHAQGSDPAARELLENLREKYESFESFEINFEILIEQPEKPSETQKGQLIQRGEQYKLDMSDQIISSDGKLVWVYLKRHNEVQIDNADTDDENISSFSPRKILEHFNSGDYEYRILNNPKTSGFLTIEFKPLNEDSEYSKMNLKVNSKKNEISEIRLFSKDASKFTVSIKEMIPDKNYSDKVFIFDSSQYPGIYIEDLRIE